MCRAGLLVAVRDGFLLLDGRAIGRCIFRNKGAEEGGLWAHTGKRSMQVPKTPTVQDAYAIINTVIS